MSDMHIWDEGNFFTLPRCWKIFYLDWYSCELYLSRVIDAIERCQECDDEACLSDVSVWKHDVKKSTHTNNYPYKKTCKWKKMNDTQPYRWHIVGISSLAIVPLTCRKSTRKKSKRKSSHKNPKSYNPVFWNTYELYDGIIYKKMYECHGSLEE